MVVQYPHTLTTKETHGLAIANADGDYTGSVTETVELSACRLEMNSGGAVLTLTDSTKYVFDSVVQLPKTCPTVCEGTTITVLDSAGQVIAAGTVKRFQAAQLHSRLWL